MRLLLTLVAFLACIAATTASPAQWVEVDGGAWHPDAAALAKVEEMLRPAAVAAAKNRGQLADWTTYTFQYQGRESMIRGKFIFINAFCSSPSAALNKVWVEVLDGGACYFSAKFDPKTHRIYDLSVNGVA